MGFYDTVMVPCPSCGTKSAFQSKGGRRSFVTYELEEAPGDVLSDINRHSPSTCEQCGTKYGVKFELVQQPIYKATSVIWPQSDE